MNSTQKLFVSLLSSHLNSTLPRWDNNCDGKELYRLAAVNGVSAITANELLRLPEKECLSQEILSQFRQQIGYTLMDFEEKERVCKKTVEVFCNENIDFLIVKGYVLRELYPVKEYRTGGDIDFIIRKKDLQKCEDALKTAGFALAEGGSYEASFDFDGQHIEVHTQLDCDHKYFEDIFDMCKNEGNRYYIDNETHLLYVLCHIIKHFRLCGTGIKMFMDIDVLIRHIDNFNYDAFMKRCSLLGIEAFAKAAFSLCNYWFNTPVKAEIDFKEEAEFRELFETEIIEGGSFGFERRGLGSYYLGKAKGAGKIRAFFKMLFPDIKYLKSRYKYADAHPALIPFAWLHRLFSAIFIRGGHSLNTAREIANSGDSDSTYRQLLRELEIAE